MTKAKVYSHLKTSRADVLLPGEYGGKVNELLLAQALRVYVSRTHPGLSKTKTRAEIKRTKRKAYKQKGTGFARHGAKSAPIFVGGGTAHGPKGIKRVLRLPGKIVKKALFSSLSYKAKEGKVVVLSDISKITSTKNAAKAISRIRKDTKAKKSILALSDSNNQFKKYYMNIKDLEIIPYSQLNAMNVYLTNILIVDSEVFVKAVSKTVKTKKKEVK